MTTTTQETVNTQFEYNTPDQVRIIELELELDSEKKKNEKLVEKIRKLQNANVALVSSHI
jgi:hypothetical protein